MLAMPGFDTYGAMQARARHPGSIEARLAFNLLRRRTVKELVWQVFTTLTPNSVADKILELRTGTGTSVHTTSSRCSLFDEKAVREMSTDERDDIYIDILKSVGMHIDKEALAAHHAQDKESKKKKQEVKSAGAAKKRKFHRITDK